MPTKDLSKKALQRKKYQKSLKGKASVKAAQQRYYSSTKGKAARYKARTSRAQYEKARSNLRSRSLTRRFKAGKKSANKRNLEFTIEFERWIEEIRKPCYYCSNQLGPPTETGIGLDRLDNKQGYIDSNIVSCCKVCNLLKSDRFTAQETKVMVDAVLKFRSPPV